MTERKARAKAKARAKEKARRLVAGGPWFFPIDLSMADSDG
jgi:hypothetical protein